MDVQSLLQQAVTHHRQGDLAAAEPLYLQIIRTDPANPAALQLLGTLRIQLGRHDEAATLLEAALKTDPDNLGALCNYGSSLRALGRAQDALASYDRALRLKPDLIEAIFNRGAVLLDLRRFDDALDAFDKTLALRSDHSQALCSRAIALAELRRLDQALKAFDQAAASTPGNDAAWSGRGLVLRNLKRFEEALASLDKAIAINPRNTQALQNRAYLLSADMGQIEPAIRDLERALDLDPGHPYGPGELLHLQMYVADWHDFDRLTAQIEQGLRQGARVARPFAYMAIAQSPEQAQAASHIFAADQYPDMSVPTHFPKGRDKIRLGYLSGEFREQATAYLMAGLYELHDRNRFELVALDSGTNDFSPMRKRLEEAFDTFVNIGPLSDQDAAKAIRDEEIDILVNLNGYFGASRPGIFARRAAPIQVNYLGFPGTLGASYMDYIVADRIVIPESEQQFYTEKVAYLPDSYQVNDSRREIAPVKPSRSDHRLPENGFVFCNFNQSYKLTPDVFASWMRILKAVPGSVLWLLDSRSPFASNLTREAERKGISGERLIFAPTLPLPQHLARLQLADLMLDNLPCNAHTGSSDALWAGLPLLTCRGATFPGRVAASLLTAAGLADMIAETLDDYEQRAIALATDGSAMAALKTRLAQNRATCPLFDTDLFRQRLEAAYIAMWERWRQGLPPAGFAV